MNTIKSYDRPQSTKCQLHDGQATLELLVVETGRTRLQPASENMLPIIIERGRTDAALAGKRLKIIRDCD